jgi:hypothetical protein
VVSSKYVVGVRGKLGVCSEFADTDFGGVLMPMPAVSSMATTVVLIDTF